jgi:hypothetical protein
MAVTIGHWLSEVACLTHPLLMMGKDQPGMVGGVPDKVVPVAPLDPILPSAKEQRMHLPGKQVGERVAAYGKGDRMEQIAGVGCKAERKVGVGLRLYRQHLLFGT